MALKEVQWDRERDPWQVGEGTEEGTGVKVNGTVTRRWSREQACLAARNS